MKNKCTSSTVVPLRERRTSAVTAAGWMQYRSELIEAARQALCDGWQPHELVEVLKAHARKLGVELPTEHAEFLARVVL